MSVSQRYSSLLAGLFYAGSPSGTERNDEVDYGPYLRRFGCSCAVASADWIFARDRRDRRRYVFLVFERSARQHRHVCPPHAGEAGSRVSPTNKSLQLTRRSFGRFGVFASGSVYCVLSRHFVPAGNLAFSFGGGVLYAEGVISFSPG